MSPKAMVAACSRESRHDALPLQTAQRLLDDVTPERLLAPDEDGQHRAQGGSLDHRHQRHLLLEPDVTPAASIPEARRDLPTQRGEGGGLRVGHPGRIQELPAPVE